MATLSILTVYVCKTIQLLLCMRYEVLNRRGDPDGEYSDYDLLECDTV
jgi:hypothetical protein